MDLPNSKESVSSSLQRLAATRVQFEKIDTKAIEWTQTEEANRQSIYQNNRNWFTTGTVYESSIFLYFDLVSSPELIRRADFIQRECATVLGKENFNPAPANRLHFTILTELVQPNGLLEDANVHAVAQKYQDYVSALHRCDVSALYPHMTQGGVILECRIDEPSVFQLREQALMDESAQPRVPAIEYATLGYITGGSNSELATLYSTLHELQNDLAPITVPVTELHITLTVNKKLVEPHLSFPLTG